MFKIHSLPSLAEKLALAPLRGESQFQGTAHVTVSGVCHLRCTSRVFENWGSSTDNDLGGFRREARCAWLSEDSLAFDNVIIKMDGIGEVKTEKCWHWRLDGFVGVLEPACFTWINKQGKSLLVCSKNKSCLECWLHEIFYRHSLVFILILHVRREVEYVACSHITSKQWWNQALRPFSVDF